MNLQDQLVNFELSKLMNELGFKQDSLFYYIGNTLCINTAVEVKMAKLDKNIKDFYSAYTVAELGEMLPKNYSDLDGLKVPIPHYLGKGWEYRIYHGYNPKKEFSGYSTTEADARAKMLIYLKQNNLI